MAAASKSTQKGKSQIKSQVPGYPVGFRFVPSEEELVGYFLWKKIKGQVEDFLPNVFHELKSLDCHPKDLGESHAPAVAGQWYFFVPGKQEQGKGKRKIQRAGTGYWKASDCEDVTFQGQKLGKKQTFVFYEGDPNGGTETHWIMDEFVIEKFPSWVCCKIRDSALDDIHLINPCGACGRT